MQGQGIAGERRPVYLAWIHWMGGDNGVTGGSNETPRTWRGGGWSDYLFRFGWPLGFIRPARLFWHQRQLVAAALPVGQKLSGLRPGVAAIYGGFDDGDLFITGFYSDVHLC